MWIIQAVFNYDADSDTREQTIKYFTLAVAGMFVALLVVGCRQPNADGPANVRVTAISLPGTPWDDGWVRFEQRVASHPSSREIDLAMYTRGQLGSEESMLTNLRRGRIHIGGYSLQGASSMVPELSILLAPYLFESSDEVDFVMDRYLVEAFTRLFAAQGAQFLQWAEVGWTNLYSVEPILTPEQAAGRAMRSSPALGARAFGKSLGMDLISITFPEVIPALQTGLIEGGQSGTVMFALAGMGKEAPHITLTRHAFDTGLIIANAQWWQGLKPAARRVLQDSFDKVQEGREGVRIVERELLKAGFAEMGVTVHQLDSEGRNAWRNIALQSHQALIDDIGGDAQEIYDIIQAGKKAFKETLSTTTE